ncbi:right-handed parallel beta-helix repeat-containing protein, partial [Candidatus Micrarchaeota archaeon]|nr:right-handed parallel beta-helix repeat-containing protein [Candidatus Micrarchaeota archaeon]
MNWKLLTGLIVLIFLFSFTSAQTYYVSQPNGNDNNDGLSVSTAWKTITKANNTHQSGDTVYFLPGDYRETFLCGSGQWNSTLCPKSGSPGNSTKFIGLGNREDIKILGSEKIENWSLCSDCENSNVYKAVMPVTPRIRCEEYTDGRHDYPSTDCWLETGNTSKVFKRADLIGEQHNTGANKTWVDEPGEFYYDRTTNTVYLKAFDNSNPNNLHIECSARALAQWGWSLDQKGQYIIMENLSLKYSAWSGMWMNGRVKDLNIINNDIGYNSASSSCGNNVGGIIHRKEEVYCSSGYEPENLLCMKQVNVIGNKIHDQSSDLGEFLSQGIVFYDVKDSLVAGNEIYNVGIPIYIKGKVDNVTIKDNLLYNYRGDAIFSNLAVENIKIIGNRIYNPLHNTTFETGSISIGGDYLYGVWTTTDNWTIINNTFWNMNNDYGYGSGYGPMMGYQGATRGHILKNNVFANVKTDIGTGGYGSDYHNYEFESNHNLFYEPVSASNLEFWQDAAHISLATWKSTTSQDLDAIVIAGTAPLFNNASAADFSLKSDSQAIDAGTITPYHCTRADDNPTNPYPAGDTSCRHWRGSAPDLGALEFGGTPAPCTNGNIRYGCTTTDSCPGFQTCVNGSWGACTDIPDDGCPVIPCNDTDPPRDCTTSENCPGTQICSAGNWGTCTDKPDDGCPTPTPGTITATHLVPSSDSSFPQGQSFTYMTKVSCSGGYCGNVTATLDPTFGYTEIGAGSNNAVANYLLLSKFTAPESGTIDSITAHLTYSEVVFVIYSETGSLLAQSAPKASDNGWTTAPISLQVTAGTKYWLGWIQGKNGTSDPWRKYDIATAGQGTIINAGTVYPNPPSNLPSSGNSNQKISIYATYTAGSSKGTIPVGSGTPFYVDATGINPQTCSNLADGGSCTNTWSVIPTGSVGDSFSFFVKYEPENTVIPSKNTSIKMITISEGTGCQENWTCTEWSACIGGNQTRTCTDNNNCGTTNNKPIETQSCSECEFTDFRPCTTTESCNGTQYCNQNGTWDPVCYDTFPNDNCPILACADGELITQECECGEQNYSSGYCCQNTHQDTPCISDCSEGPITQACYCGNNIYDTGYCCGTGGMQPPVYQTYSCNATCTPGDPPQNCTTIDDCSGTQTCNTSGFWGSCIDTPNDNCPICIPEWTCTPYSECVDNQKTRTCTDDNDCGINTGKPSEIQSCGLCDFMDTQDCVTDEGCTGSQVCDVTGHWDSACYDNNPEDNCPACIEEWDCSSWNTCTNGNQTRNCTDLSECGTAEFKPSISQSCGTCSSGVTQACTTSQGCAGIQTCVNESWGSCADITG